MTIETSEQAAQAAHRVEAFLLGLSVGRAHLGISDMLRAISDIRYFLLAEKETTKEEANEPRA